MNVPRRYLQFASLALLSLLFLFLSLLFLHTLYTDIHSRLSSLTLEIRSEIMQCAKAYVDNRCEPATRIPAMERKCSGWEECMGREVVVVGKTRVVAETLAEVVNGFVDVISFKTMVRPLLRTILAKLTFLGWQFFVILTLGLTIYGSSVALSILPSRPMHQQPSYPLPSQHLGPPHFQHLGYQYPSAPQFGLQAPNLAGYGADWALGEGKEREGRAAKETKAKGWFS